MAYRYNVSDLKRSTIRNIAGMCVDSADFLNVTNEVQRRLMRRGNWDDTAWLVKLCVEDGCVTWPHYVGTVLGARFCDGSMADMQNGWYAITQQLYPANTFYDGASPWRYGDGSRFNGLVFEDAGRGPTHNNIGSADGRLIRYYVKYQNDIGKKITIYGKKFGGQPLQHLDTDGNYVDGMVLTAAAPFATSSTLVTEITAVVREATQGLSYLYEYDAATDKLRDLAVYQPNETNPRYRKSWIVNYCNLPGCTRTTTVSGVDYLTKVVPIEAMVKLQVFDLVNDNDFLMIDNFDAFKLAFQAVKLEEANDDKAAEVKWIKAIRELNMDIRDKTPDDQTPVFYNVTMGHCLYNPI